MNRIKNKPQGFHAFVWLALMGMSLLGAGTSCNTVEFYEKGRLVTPAMNLAQDPTLTHFEQKVFYSIEGAAGGIGASAGGGCGCY